MNTAKVVAAYVIKKSNETGVCITNLRLQKLLYFIQGLSLSSLDRVAFGDDIEAWHYGPVVYEVYSNYAFKGSSPIHNDEVFEFRLNKQHIDDLKEIFIEKNDIDELVDDDLKKLIDDIVEKTKGIDDFNLVTITHNHSPWKNVYDSSNIHKIISKESIKEFFKGEKNG